MNVLVVVLAQLLLFLGAPAPQRLLYVAFGIFAADHESNLARGICWDGCVSVLSNGEYFLAVLLELRDEWEV